MIDFAIPRVHVINNFVPPNYQDYLYKTYTTKKKWFLEGLDLTTSYPSKEHKEKFIDPDNPVNNNIEENYQFTLPLLNTDSEVFDIENHNPLYLLHYLQLHSNYEYDILPIRCKLNFQTPVLSFKETCHNEPHTDLSNYHSDHYSMVYYLNDSDGDTIIFNETLKDTPIKNFTIDKKITPKKGTAVIFPGYHFHCGTTPRTSQARIVANFNFRIRPSITNHQI